MTTSEKQSEQGQGSGLPVGWGWREDDDYHESLYLFAPGNAGMDYHGAAYTDGSWTAYPSAHADDDATYHDANMSAPRSPEALAAGQREVEDVLRRAGVFDAVRAPVAEPAPLPCPDCKRRECFAGVRQCDAAKRAESGEPAPRELPAPTDDPGDELARLLPGLAHDLDMVTDLRFESQRSTPIQRVATAARLLLAERERLTRELAEAQTFERVYRVARRSEEHVRERFEAATAEIDQLRARVAELEAANEGLAQIVNARVASPPPGTVATLLAPVLDLHAQIGDALDGEHRSNLIEALLYALGDARATLGAPTPLAGEGSVATIDRLLARVTEAEAILGEIDDVGYGGDGTDQSDRVRRFVHFPSVRPAKGGA